MLRSATQIVCLIICLSFQVFGQNVNKFNPEKGAHIVFLGNTFADRMRHFGYFETLLQKNFPGKELTVRNMGWSADEVGLQPRPLNFPGFRNSDAVQSEASKEVSFKNYKFEGERIVMPIPLNFAGLHQDLTEQKADIIFLCFGMNESFKGAAGLPQFEKDLKSFTNALLAQKYNGRSAPQLILVSPIAHEDLGGYLPKPDEHNKNLQLYSKAIQKYAAASGLIFIDLFTPSQARMKANPKTPLTINGIHLTGAGYGEAARWMANQLGFATKNVSLDFASANATKLREVIKMKDDHFFYRWRAVNGEYIYGRRREPFGVLSFPPELKKLTKMAASLDSVIWQLGKNSGTEGFKKAKEIVDERGKPATLASVPDVVMTGRQGATHTMGDHAAHQPKIWPATTEKFTVPAGYEINLFASEKDFPVEKPVAMNFDAKGRLWVATMPTYPQYFPGIPVHDRIVILEDTDGDGKADKHTVFADDLYLPLGFEFYNGGILVSQEPDIVFLKDTDGDDKADIREVILTGFGSEDSHHATHAFTFGQDGALYFNEGTFLNSQVETPYGPIHSYSGATYRFEPRTGKLEHYISYPYYNPWGSVFDKWGMHLIGDASDGSNYFAPPMTGKITYPDKHPRINMFTTTRVRPTAGIEIVSSRQFPEEVQGDFLVNNNIGFQGTKQHKIIVNGSGITSKEVEPILQSSDPNFRPIDLKFGPDGALYVVDWYNPLVSHGENPPRDPMRDKLHGRIWRITYKDKPILKKTDVSTQSIAQLLDNLKEPEDRFRYRSRAQIREQPAAKVLPELQKWTKMQSPADPQYEHNLLEALWLYQDFDVIEPALLRKLLASKDDRARTAATRVLRYWQNRITDAVELFGKSINDSSPRVRLEAVVALSYSRSGKIVETAADVFKYPTDYYLDYAINETFSYLKPVWLAGLGSQNFLAGNPKAVSYLLNLASADELKKLPQTPVVLEALLERKDLTAEAKNQVVQELAKQTKKSGVEILVTAIRKSESNNDLIPLLLSDKKSLVSNWEWLYTMIGKNESNRMKAVGYAALLTADETEESVIKTARENSHNTIAYLNGIALLTDKSLQASFYEKVKTLTKQVSAESKSGTEADSLRATAYKVFSVVPGNEAEKAQEIAGLIQANGKNTGLAAEIIASKTDAELKANYAKPAVIRIVDYVKEVPENQRAEPQYNSVIALGKRLASFLPKTDSEKILEVLNNSGTLEIQIAAIPAKMLFDKDIIPVKSGRLISLTFTNPDMMPHNVVILKPGTAQKVGEAADAMAGLKDGFEKNFIPDLPEILFSTPLVNSGGQFVLNFKAPQIPGDYPFICSFPGHWRVMKGVLKVE
jgi:glucose/arabinose dehydrogenase/azurin